MQPIITPYSSETEWRKDRPQFIGCSEVAAVLETINYRPDRYKSRLRLYLEKIGEPIEPFYGNPITKEGKRAESDITEMFQYWDFQSPDNETMWDNYESRRKLREVKTVNNYFQHPEYDWLRGSIDGYFEDNGIKTGVEAKNTTSLALSDYVGKVNPAWYIQIQCYMIVTGYSKFILCMKIDGNKRENLVFTPDTKIQEHIIKETAKFWQQVLQARAIKEEYGLTEYYTVHSSLLNDRQRIGVQILQSIEPEVTGHPDEDSLFAEFFKKKEESIEVEGSQKMWDYIREYLEYEKEIKRVYSLSSQSWEKFLLELNGANVAIFDDGRVSYKPDVRGRMRKHISETLHKAIIGD